MPFVDASLKGSLAVLYCALSVGCSHASLVIGDSVDGGARDSGAGDRGHVAPPDLVANAFDLSADCDGAGCNGLCVDLQSDPQNCGACGHACGDGMACRMGACARSLVGPSLCFMDPPNGAMLAPPPPKYQGTCPMLIGADKGENTLMSSGNARLFKVAIPANLDPKEKLPVIFLWHWLGGSADGFYSKGEVQAAVDQQRFLAVIPDNKKVNGKSDLLWKWPFAVSDTQQRINEELQFFDDMYACVAAQFNINKECVASVGVSAGALFTDQLASARADMLASAVSLSGGTGGLVRPWGNPKRALPVMVLWGGQKDICIVINFQDASHNLEDALGKEGNFFLECVHNCGHGEPPFEEPMGLSKYAPMWQFVFDHPYWLAPGDSPYLKQGIPAEYPSWCAIGKGNAVPRMGACPPPGC